MPPKDRDKYNAYMRGYLTKRYRDLMDECKESLGGACAECGTTDDLEFDHVDKTTKEFTITDGMAVSRPRLFEELRKCQLLCTSCHKKKTSAERFAELKHGRAGMYKRGCRCDECRTAQNAYVQEWRKKNGRKKIIPS